MDTANPRPTRIGLMMSPLGGTVNLSNPMDDAIWCAPEINEIYHVHPNHKMCFIEKVDETQKRIAKRLHQRRSRSYRMPYEEPDDVAARKLEMEIQARLNEVQVVPQGVGPSLLRHFNSDVIPEVQSSRGRISKTTVEHLIANSHLLLRSRTFAENGSRSLLACTESMCRRIPLAVNVDLIRHNLVIGNPWTPVVGKRVSSREMALTAPMKMIIPPKSGGIIPLRWVSMMHPDEAAMAKGKPIRARWVLENVWEGTMKVALPEVDQRVVPQQITSMVAQPGSNTAPQATRNRGSMASRYVDDDPGAPLTSHSDMSSDCSCCDSCSCSLHTPKSNRGAAPGYGSSGGDAADLNRSNSFHRGSDMTNCMSVDDLHSREGEDVLWDENATPYENSPSRSGALGDGEVKGKPRRHGSIHSNDSGNTWYDDRMCFRRGRYIDLEGEVRLSSEGALFFEDEDEDEDEDVVQGSDEPASMVPPTESSPVGRPLSKYASRLTSFTGAGRLCSACSNPQISFQCAECPLFFLCDDCRDGEVAILHDPDHTFIDMMKPLLGEEYRSFDDVLGGNPGVSLQSLGSRSFLHDPCAECKRVNEDFEPVFRCSECNLILCMGCAKGSSSEVPKHPHPLVEFRRRGADETVMGSKRTRSMTADKKEVINDYVILGIIGAGAFATVQKVMDLETRKYYAMKTLTIPAKEDSKLIAAAKDDKKKAKKLKRGGKDAEAPAESQVPTQAPTIKAVMREITVMSVIKHPNIVSIREVISDPRAHKVHLVMDLCECGPIHMLEEPPIPVSVLRHYARDIMRGLVFMHSQFVYHRDVKPANCLVAANGVAKLADFGTTLGQVCSPHGDGTVVFMCPEVLHDVVITGEMADSWAYGLTICQAAMGFLPVPLNLRAFREWMKKKKSVPLPEDMPWDLQDLLKKLLHPNIKKRKTVTQLVHHPFFIDYVDPRGDAELLYPPSRRLWGLEKCSFNAVERLLKRRLFLMKLLSAKGYRIRYRRIPLGNDKAGKKRRPGALMLPSADQSVVTIHSAWLEGPLVQLNALTHVTKVDMEDCITVVRETGRKQPVLLTGLKLDGHVLLRTIRMCECRLTEIPNELLGAPNLRLLDLSRNLIKTLTVEFTTHRFLKVLNLNNNLISDIEPLFHLGEKETRRRCFVYLHSNPVDAYLPLPPHCRVQLQMDNLPVLDISRRLLQDCGLRLSSSISHSFTLPRRVVDSVCLHVDEFSVAWDKKYSRADLESIGARCLVVFNMNSPSVTLHGWLKRRDVNALLLKAAGGDPNKQLELPPFLSADARDYVKSYLFINTSAEEERRIAEHPPTAFMQLILPLVRILQDEIPVIAITSPVTSTRGAFFTFAVTILRQLTTYTSEEIVMKLFRQLRVTESMTQLEGILNEIADSAPNENASGAGASPAPAK